MMSFDKLRFGAISVLGVKRGEVGLFRAHKGKRLIAAHRTAGLTPFVGASRVNNSITDFADTPAMFPKGWVTLIYNGDGGTGHAKYQPAPFSASDDVIALEPLSQNASESALLLIASMLTQQCVPKFSFGYKLTLHRLARQKIMVPVMIDASGEQEVDWECLTQLGAELLVKAKERAKTVRAACLHGQEKLPDLTFEPMLITDIFETMKSSSAWYDKVHIKPGLGKNVYLSQTRLSNGMAGCIADQLMPPEPGNCITITLKTQATFYQPASFYTAQNFLIFRHPSLNSFNSMVLVTAIRRAVEKFSWGYGVSMGRLRKTRIMIPVKFDEAGQQVVDWEGMTRYGCILRAKAEKKMDTILQ